jgi:GNAT superfamily N-acetyltransferase
LPETSSVTAVLAGLYVRPAHRGDGTGGRLVAEFRRWARERGARYAEVTAYAANADAVRFYERHGFGALTLTLRRPLEEPAR